MKIIKLNLLVLLLIVFSQTSYATNPIPVGFNIEDVSEIKIEKKQSGNIFSKTWKKLKHTVSSFVKAANLDKSIKFLIGWLGCGALGVINYLGGYFFFIALFTEFALVVYLLLLLSAAYLSVVSSIFFVLWIVEIVKISQDNVRVEDQTEEQEETDNRRKRKKNRRRN